MNINDDDDYLFCDRRWALGELRWAELEMSSTAVMMLTMRMLISLIIRIIRKKHEKNDL